MNAIDREKILARFWPKVSKTEACWLWTGARNDRGYGQLAVGGKKIGAHRLAMLLLRGVDPGALFVMHACDVPACVNPLHLAIGTQSENMLDAVEKGRCVGAPRISVCGRGHPMVGENVELRHRGTRVERACHACRHARSSARAKARTLARAAIRAGGA